MSARYVGIPALLVVLAAGQLGAQSMITTAKTVAQNAVAASNAQTAAMQNTEGPKPTSVVISTPTRRYVPVAVPTSVSATPVSTAPVRTTSVATTPVKAEVARMALTPAKTIVAASVPAHAMMAPPAAGLPSDTGARTISVTQRGTKGEVSLNREVFSYDAGGRRDPFVSLMQNGDLRPLISDLRLVTVLYDPTGRNSVAVMHDVGAQTTTQYRVRVGQTLGRMRVAQIDPKQVVFTIEEVGFSRRETLALGDSTTARTQ